MKEISSDCGDVLSDPFYGIHYPRDGQILESEYNLLQKTKYKNTSLSKFYKNVPNVDQQTSIGEWIFLPISKLETSHNKFVDFGMAYRGMGYVLVLFYIIDTDNFAVRMDGGSSSIDRDYNYTQYSSVKYQPKEFAICIDDITELDSNCQYTLDVLNKFLDNNKDTRNQI